MRGEEERKGKGIENWEAEKKETGDWRWEGGERMGDEKRKGKREGGGGKGRGRGDGGRGREAEKKEGRR